MKNKSKAFLKQEQVNKIKEYRFPACELLKSLIKEFLVVECENSTPITTLPSASVSLNYILNGTIEMKLKNNEVIELPKAFAFGIARNSLHFEFSDCTTLFSIIFNPGMASTLVNIPINEFFESFIPFDDFFNVDQISFIEKQFEEKCSYEGFINVIEKFLIMDIEWAHTDEIVKEAIYDIIHSKGSVSIKSLLDKFSISRDSFEKKFRKQVGTSPKKFSNIVRFRNLFENNDNETTLTKVGLDAGYYDQSHFIKDFKAITGKKPSDFQ